MGNVAAIIEAYVADKIDRQRVQAHRRQHHLRRAGGRSPR
jgi:hypothetical protein